MFVVFDLDGTLADITGRLHHIKGKNRDYTSFFAACVDDVPITTTINTLNAHYDEGHRVEIWSARSSVVRRETEDWLICAGIDPRLLTHMRAVGDHTEDATLKRSWLHALHPDERPDIVYDDRQRVVDMWRDEGVTCFQVAANWEAPQRIAPICEPLLTIMVGPSGAGKSTWLKTQPDFVVSSDDLRDEYTGSAQDQSRNDDVFYALHKIAAAQGSLGMCGPGARRSWRSVRGRRSPAC